MADFSPTDLGSIYGAAAMANKDIKIQKKGENLDLDMTDFIQLMITQLTNQGIDESVDTSDMLNQMIQMQMVETIATLTDASVMSYAASLVGKDVTVGKLDGEGKLQEIYGTVTGTGTMNGNQVVFIDNGEYYQMSEIMAVGKLPPKEDDKTEGTEGTEGTQKPDETKKPDGTQETDETKKPDGTQETDETQKTDGTQEAGNTERPDGSGHTDAAEDTKDTDSGSGTETVTPSQETAGTGSPEYNGEDGAPDDQGA